VEFVRLLLVFLHLLGMGMLVAMIMLQAKAGKDAPVNKGWLHGAALQLLTGVALVGIDPLVDSVKYDHIKIGVKLLVVVAQGPVLAHADRRVARRAERGHRGLLDLIEGCRVHAWVTSARCARDAPCLGEPS
jgi:hypothetical protein